MRQLSPHSLFLGHAGDRSDSARIHRAGIRAVIDLAVEEPPATFAREIAYGRIPLTDGRGNPPALIRAALDLTASFLRSRTPTLICCSAGMSRSPCIAAGAIAIVTNTPPADALLDITAGHPADISPGLWESILAALAPRERPMRLIDPVDQA